MLLALLMCSTIFIPLISGSSTTPSVSYNSTKSLLLSKETKVENDIIKTNVTIISEGGPAIPSTPSMTLPKQNQTVLLSLDKELGTEKSVQLSGSKVKPRKGVDYQPDNGTSVGDDITVIHQLKTLDTSKQIEDKPETQPIQHKDTLPSSALPTSNIKENKTITKQPLTIKHLNKTELHKKPQILSYEVLSEMDKKLSQNKNLKLADVQSSSKSVVQDQMPSPRKENGPSLKIQPTSSNRHPGMVMPVVITILVVPMFAVLGYMALRRGQEAWKNRHYKRMDFLLDGMYNE
ncbi:uncharacterized protein LOC126366324 [Pectinophora gossypiella]|uniref:uncharacterized protein LOC126366324 n=1 Tax=Pectinophora gossypiella TaxID=13191 RepID=UPI00214EB725|nr:uncharacterized protein LOC126366324 [Pectinophora gossypiella]